eukprot:7603681-Pyramimonas_sp.AAC.2
MTSNTGSPAKGLPGGPVSPVDQGTGVLWPSVSYGPEKSTVNSTSGSSSGSSDRQPGAPTPIVRRFDNSAIEADRQAKLALRGGQSNRRTRWS